MGFWDDVFFTLDDFLNERHERRIKIAQQKFENLVGHKVDWDQPGPRVLAEYAKRQREP
jgi:hypothetical protein